MASVAEWVDTPTTIRWRGTIVGQYTDDFEYPPGGWGAKGPWQPLSTPVAMAFEALARTVDGQQPIAEPRVWVELLSHDGERWTFYRHAVVVSLRGEVIELKIMWESQPPAPEAEPGVAPDTGRL